MFIHRGGDYTNCAREYKVINNRRSIDRTGLEKILGSHLSEKRGMESDGLRERQRVKEREREIVRIDKLQTACGCTDTGCETDKKKEKEWGKRKSRDGKRE